MAVTNYLWDMVNDNVLAETDENGDLIAEYTYEPDHFGNLISQQRDGVESFYHFDGQGSTKALTDGNGDVTDIYAYTGFGEEVSKTGTTETPYCYVGEKGYQFDREMDDYYVRVRTYSPSRARWCCVDPGASGLNLFQYVGNNPLGHVDPSGLIERRLISLFGGDNGAGQAAWEFVAETPRTPKSPALVVIQQIRIHIDVVGCGERGPLEARRMRGTQTYFEVIGFIPPTSRYVEIPGTSQNVRMIADANPVGGDGPIAFPRGLPHQRRGAADYWFFTGCNNPTTGAIDGTIKAVAANQVGVVFLGTLKAFALNRRRLKSLKELFTQRGGRNYLSEINTEHCQPRALPANAHAAGGFAAIRNPDHKVGWWLALVDRAEFGKPVEVEAPARRVAVGGIGAEASNAGQALAFRWCCPAQGDTGVRTTRPYRFLPQVDERGNAFEDVVFSNNTTFLFSPDAISL